MITRRVATAGLATALIGLSQTGRAQPSPGPATPGFRLTAAPASRKVRHDATGPAELWTFNGELHPVLRVKHGAELSLSLANDTPSPLSLHFQGVRGPNAMDGVGGLTEPPIIRPGQIHEYRFTPPDPGTFLIRPCVLGGSAEPLERGLSAMLVVEEASPPRVDQDLAVLVDDWLLNDDGTLSPFEKSVGESPAGRLGNWLSIGGMPAPQRVEMPQGGRLRLRLANGCNARTMRLRFDGLRPYVVAVDGQPAGTFEPLRSSLPFAPGNRYDLLLDVPGEPNAKGSVTAAIGTGLPLIEVVTTAEKRPELPPIAPLPANGKLPEAIRLQSASRKDIVIADAKPLWTVNGAPGSTRGAPLLKVKRGTPVVLALTNRTPLVQPMHLHGHAFRLLHPLDDGWEPYFLDTVQVPENKTVRIAFVADNPGRWLLASTVMERFDAGLWTWIEVT